MATSAPTPSGADLEVAQHLCDLADTITLARFRALDLQVDTKPDSTPVTDADLAVEATIRAELASRYPDDAVLGEEHGLSAGSSGRRWVLDPIDGTKNFARGVPIWATLLSLEVDGQATVCVISAPALNRRWWAERRQGAWAQEPRRTLRRLAVSTVGELSDASMSYSSLSGWETLGRLDGFLDLTRALWRTRAYGDFWSHVMVAEGLVDLAAEPQVTRWDLSAVALLVEEAGGRLSGLNGVNGPGEGSALTSNGLLHNVALNYLCS